MCIFGNGTTNLQSTATYHAGLSVVIPEGEVRQTAAGASIALAENLTEICQDSASQAYSYGLSKE